MDSLTKISAQMWTFASEKLGKKPKESYFPRVTGSIEKLPEHPIFLYGFPKEGSTHGTQAEFVLARTLQRHPNAGVRKNLYQLHSSMAEKFKDMPDESLEWLLGGSRRTSRGGFANVGEFREFLATNPDDIPPSFFITGLETITTAIGYRAIGANWTEAPFFPKTPCQRKMYEVIYEITKGERVCAIDTVYRQRSTDRAVKGQSGKTFIFCEQDHTLSNSDGKRNLGQPNERIPSAQFNVTSKNNQPSWIAEAVGSNVNVRNHVSGTASLSLASVTGLLRENLTSEEESRDLFTTLLLPQFLRSDFHSLAETQAGIDHFMAERKHKMDHKQPRSTMIDPKTAQRRALASMCDASSDSDEMGLGITPQQAMRDFLAEQAQTEGGPAFFAESGEGYYPAFTATSFMTPHQVEQAFQRKQALQQTPLVAAAMPDKNNVKGEKQIITICE